MNSANVKLKFFDENTGWSDRRPAANNLPALKNVTVTSLDLHHVELSEIDRFNEFLAENTPTVVLVHRVTPSAYQRLKNSSSVRKMYSVLEASRMDGYEDFSVTLLKLGLLLDNMDVNIKADNKSLHWQPLNILAHVPNGPTINLVTFGLEQSMGAQRKLTHTASVLKATASSTADIAMVITNAMDGGFPDEALRDFHSARAALGYSDVIEESVEKPPTSPWSFWMRSPKYMAHATPDMVRGQVPHLWSCVIAARTAGGAATISIPMPRSAKTGGNNNNNNNTKSPSSSSSPAANQVLTDPAVVSAEAAKSSNNTSASSPGSEIIMRLMRQQQQQAAQAKWKMSHSFLLKGTDAKLSNTESVFDVSSLFPTPAEAVDALNSKSLNWPADFCVVHGNVLCSDTVAHCDRQSFRRYARDVKGNTSLTAQIYAATSSLMTATQAAPLVGSAAADKSAWLKATRGGEQQQHQQQQQQQQQLVEEFSNFQRQLKRDDSNVRREWSEASCTIVYQLTPREMKLNITNVIGTGKNNLKEAIYFLNRTKGTGKESNPLYDYPYDYALLYSAERQGYWLMAATHVPCDIVACRMVL